MKKFIIAVIAVLAIIFIFLGINHRRYEYEVYNSYNNNYAYHENTGNGLVHSAVKGAVEGYVAGKVINHGMRKYQARQQYNQYNQGHMYHQSSSRHWRR